MLKDFGGDLRTYRICMSTSDPLETYHRMESGRYRMSTLLDYIEMLDVKETIHEDAAEYEKRESARRAAEAKGAKG